MNISRMSRAALVAIMLFSLLVSTSYADTVPAEDDSIVFSYGPGDNYGSMQYVGVHNDGVGGVIESYITIDLSSVPVATSISSAKLWLYVSNVRISGTFSVYKVLAPWDENTITYVTKPTLEVLPIATVSISSGDINKYISIDVTSLTSSWINKTVKNYGLALVPSGNISVALDSKENIRTSHDPKLEMVNDPTPGMIPPGGIIMWSGSQSNIPSGWLLCDGNNNTPDLRNRFIVGAGGNYSVADTGGEDFHALTINEMPAHSHGITVFAAGGSQGAICGVYDTSWHGNTNTNLTGGGTAHENRPKYYALAYIMKM